MALLIVQGYITLGYIRQTYSYVALVQESTPLGCIRKTYVALLIVQQYSIKVHCCTITITSTGVHTIRLYQEDIRSTIDSAAEEH